MDEAVNTGKEYCGLERCEDCVNYNSCVENKEQMMEARRAVFREARKYHAYFSLKINCDYYKDARKEVRQTCKRV